MTRKKRKEPTEQAADHGDAYEPAEGEIADTDFPPADAVAPPAPPQEHPAVEGEKRNQNSFEPRPVITEVVVDAKTGEKTLAHYIDGYGRGVGVHFAFPNEAERPSEEVKQSLKEERQYGNRKQKGMRWRGDLEPKQWHKHIPRGEGVATRLETEGRFRDAVKQLRKEKEGSSRDDDIAR